MRRQKSLLPEIALEINDKLQNFDLQTESIFCGFDKSGPHVYQVNQLEYACHDGAGYFASGCGSPHFDAVFMSHGYDITWSVPDALLLLYRAKKNAESAAGVGKLTDVFVFDESRGFTGLFNDTTMNALDRHYQRYATESRKLAEIVAEAIKNDNLIPAR